MRTIEIKFYDNEDADIDMYLSVTDDELNVLKTICDRYNKSNKNYSSRLILYEKQKMEKEEWVPI